MSRRTQTLKIFTAAAPITLPVGSEHVKEFFDVFFKYQDGNNVLRMIFEVFGMDNTIRFVSRFHGMSLSIPDRSYWEDKFRDVHCYLVLRTISKQDEPDRWRQTVAKLARLYHMSGKNVLKVFRAVQATRSK
jgi:hypothetical protein